MKPSLKVPLLTACYAIFIIFVSSFHEVWKDEVGVFSIIRTHPNLFDALSELRQYGHPFLWYLILWLFYQVLHASVALKIAHIVVAVLAMWVFLSKSPFTYAEKILFMLGYFPLYEYAVISRGYGVSILFLFITASLYSVRLERKFSYCGAVFFLAQTHVLSWIIAFFMSVLFVLEWIFGRGKGRHSTKALIISTTILIAGLAISFYSAFPGKETRATHFFDLNFLQVARESLKALVECFYVPPKIGDLLGTKNLWFLSGILWLFYSLLSKRRTLLGLFLGCFWVFNLFFNTVYFGAMRHYGLLYVLMWAVCWMYRSEDGQKVAVGQRSKLLAIALIVLSLPQVAMAYQAIELDLKMDYSASKSAGGLIKRDPVLMDAIIIAEPPAHVESLPYYVDNPIFFPREGRFGTTASMKESGMMMEYSLDSLLLEAAALKHRYGKPVLIFLEPGIAGTSPGKRQWAHGLAFSYSKEALDNFSRLTKKVAGFYGTISGENYEMYLF